MLSSVVLCWILLHLLQSKYCHGSKTKDVLVPSSDDSDEARIYKHLFTNYNRHIRPVNNKTDPVTVKLGLTLHQIVSLVEKNQHLQTSLWVRQTWKNEFLSWDPKEFGGITSINVNAEMVWVPDIYLYNNADADGDGALNKFSTHIKLIFNGMNIWLAPVLLMSSCKIDVTYFPFDEQQCSLKFGSWTYDGERLDLVQEAPRGDTSKYVQNGQWDLVSFKCKRNEIYYVCCPQSYPDVTFTLHIRRKTIFYYMNLIMPCFLITGLTLLSFLLPPESGERITLVITNLLAMTVFMLLVAEVLPPTSEVVPLISIYYTLTTFEVGLALVATCIVLKCYFTNPVTNEMPMWVRILILKWIAKFTRVKVPSAIKTIRSELDAEKQEARQEILREKAKTFGMRRMSKAELLGEDTKAQERRSSVRRVSVPTVGLQVPTRTRKVSFFQGEYPLYPELDLSSLHPNLQRLAYPSQGSSFDVQIEHEYENENGNRRKSDGSDADSPFTSMMLCRQENIANNVRRIVKMARTKEEEDLRREEWKVAAEIIDRFFWWLFLVVLVMSTIVIFMQAPRYSMSFESERTLE